MGSLIQVEFEFLSLSFSCSFCFVLSGFELFLALICHFCIGLPLFVSFVGLVIFRSSR
jgi:hypothetical protein